jgi:hypothetical protein
MKFPQSPVQMKIEFMLVVVSISKYIVKYRKLIWTISSMLRLFEVEGSFTWYYQNSENELKYLNQNNTCK